MLYCFNNKSPHKRCLGVELGGRWVDNISQRIAHTCGNVPKKELETVRLNTEFQRPGYRKELKKIHERQNLWVFLFFLGGIFEFFGDEKLSRIRAVKSQELFCFFGSNNYKYTWNFKTIARNYKTFKLKLYSKTRKIKRKNLYITRL